MQLRGIWVKEFGAGVEEDSVSFPFYNVKTVRSCGDLGCQVGMVILKIEAASRASLDWTDEGVCPYTIFATKS